MTESPKAAPTTAPASAPQDHPAALSLNIREAMLKTLSSVQRLVLLLWYAEQMTPSEIALAVEMTADQVEHHHAEAVRLLRDSVGLQTA